MQDLEHVGVVEVLGDVGSTQVRKFRAQVLDSHVQGGEGAVQTLKAVVQPVQPSGLVEHGAEEGIACTQDPGVCRDPFFVGVVPHEEDDITPVLVLVQIVSSGEDKRREVRCWLRWGNP
ncbi:hypothetical protein E2C01_022560 [Portunus trituberculatus]|uniref:Uncharacterized protein n=1 Tax=Portunus trituberculatus TaxID=210409 RepID=A0A5B7E5P6_PORTR|nr:hypothetical protein [Portunus trituberculatus]